MCGHEIETAGIYACWEFCRRDFECLELDEYDDAIG